MEREQVLHLVKQNDNDSQRALFEAYYRRTYAVVYSILRNRESAEDITQEAFIRAFQNLHQLREQDKFGPWLAVIASNLARNFLKRERRVIYTDDLASYDRGEGMPETEELALRELEVQRIRAAIKTLPFEQYQVVVLQFYYDLKVDEIAGVLKISSGTVKSRLFRARQKLSLILEQNEEDNCLIIEGGGGE